MPAIRETKFSPATGLAQALAFRLGNREFSGPKRRRPTCLHLRSINPQARFRQQHDIRTTQSARSSSTGNRNPPLAPEARLDFVTKTTWSKAPLFFSLLDIVP